MGTHLGYFGNTPVYDNRMRGDGAIEDANLPHGGHNTTGKAVAGQGLSGEERFQRKAASLKLREDTEYVELIIPYKSERGFLSYLLLDGLRVIGDDCPDKFIAFNERGNGIHLIFDNDCPSAIHPGALAEFDPDDVRQHTCHARGCASNVPPKMFMCRKHWGMVPADTQKLVWAHYQEGQELGHATPTREYLAVTDQAEREVQAEEAKRAKEKADREAEYQARKLDKENKRRLKRGGTQTKSMLDKPSGWTDDGQPFYLE